MVGDIEGRGWVPLTRPARAGRPGQASDPCASPRPVTPMSRWLSVKDIAADLSISIHTAYKWSSRGEPWFPRTIRLRNGDLRVRRDWYEIWLARMETPARQ